MSVPSAPAVHPAGPPGPAGAPRSSATAGREPARARYPDDEGYLERDGVRVFYEIYGAGRPTLLLLPTWSIVHSRCWKAQVPYLARHYRVVTFDGRGNGRSDRPRGADAYTPEQFAADTVAVMEATGTERSVLVALSCGALWATLVAANQPERVDGVIYIAPAVGLAPSHPERDVYPFDEPLETDEGWAKYNSYYWQRDYSGFLEFFIGKCFNEPHSSKQIEDCIGWALDTDPETLADTTRGIGLRCSTESFRDVCARVRCPTLVIHGDRDLVRPHAQGAALADATGGQLVTLGGAGHIPSARDPVKVNLLIRDFVEAQLLGTAPRPGPRRPTPAVARTPGASSPPPSPPSRS